MDTLSLTKDAKIYIGEKTISLTSGAGKTGQRLVKKNETRTLSLEKAMAPHSSTFAWKIPWTEEPGRLKSMGSLRVGHD